MEKIIINGKFLTQKITGVQRYAREIIRELDLLVKKDEITIAVPQKTDNLPEFRNIIIEKVGNHEGLLWEQWNFPLYVKKHHGISLNLCNVAPLINPGIVCIHDVKIKTHPEFFSKKFLLWYSILLRNETKRAKKIITVSNFSKNELVKYYKVKKDKVVVITNAWQHYERVGYDEDALEKYGLKRYGYFFVLGSMEPNKNFKWIAEQALKYPEKIFAVAGSINEKVFSEGLGFGCPENMKLLGYVSDEEAKTLMRDCEAFLFPSIYEGFGIPPLEAISAGAKNVVVSDIPVMHEIFGNVVQYINSFELDMDNVTLNSCPDRVLEKYSWKMSAKKLYDELEGIGK